jgi:hypothetical protein
MATNALGVGIDVLTI